MVDIDLKVPAIEKLLDYAASGIGAVAGTMMARWKARTEADVLHIKTQGQVDAIALITDAQNEARRKLEVAPSSVQGELEVNDQIQTRLGFQEEKRQRNIQSVVGMAAEEIKDKEVSNDPVDHDWTARFFTDVQDVSSKQMQQMWARILAGEVETPGRTSLHTLAILKNMSQKDAELFVEVAKFVIEDFILHDDIAKEIQKFPSFNVFLKLENYNLMNMGGGDLMKELTTKSICYMPDNDVLYAISERNAYADRSWEMNLPGYSLTPQGQELYGFIRTEKNADYLGALAYFLKTQKAKLQCASAFRMDGDKFLPELPWVTVEPRIPDKQEEKP